MMATNSNKSMAASKSKRAILDAAWTLRKQGMSIREAVDRALKDAGYRGKSEVGE